MNIPGYDAWKLQGPDEDRPEVGTEEGDTCNRWQEPDEDCPKPWRCNGAMRQEYEDGDFHATWTACDTCGEYA